VILTFLGFPGIGILNSSPQYGLELNFLFLDILNDSALNQLVTIPTWENSILDLVLTIDPDVISELMIVPGMKQCSLPYPNSYETYQSNIPLQES